MFERGLQDTTFVPRWTIVRKLREQTVGAHSFLVAHYVNDLCVMLRLDTITTLCAVRQALWHDVDEGYSGDMPGPSKRELVADKTAWNWALQIFMKTTYERFTKRAGLDTLNDHDAKTVKLIIKIADWMDAAMECGAEVQMGNLNCKALFDHNARESVLAVGRLAEHTCEDLSYIALAVDEAVTKSVRGVSPGPVFAPEMEEFR